MLRGWMFALLAAMAAGGYPGVEMLRPSIRGRVVDQQRRPVSGARVETVGNPTRSTAIADRADREP
jgi:hypothetical protein